jgi:type II secretory pathway component GspD/PulD (secretin)
VRQLLAEARVLQQQDRLLEARQKILEAQQLGVRFGPSEDSPDLVYQQLAYGACLRISSLVNHANETLHFGKGDAALRCQAAEKDLAQARQLAGAFGQDTQPIDRALATVDQVRSGSGVAQVGGSERMPAAESADLSAGSTGRGPADQGKALLDKARLELRNGSTANARRLAEEACSYGVRDEALMVLRSIDTEEFNQRRLRANRSFDAVQSAYNRGDYNHAGALLTAIDTKLLDERRQARLREMLMTPQMQPSATVAGRTQVAAGEPGASATGGQEAQEPRDRRPAGPGVGTQSPEQIGLPGRPGEVAAGSPGRPEVGHARATDSPEPLLAHTQAMREVKFQQLRRQGMEAQSQAAEKFRAGQTDEAIDMLQDHLNTLLEQQLDPGQLTLLRRPIESRLHQFRLMKQQAEFASRSQQSRQQAGLKMASKVKAEELKQKNVSELMKQFNDLYRQGHYAEAEALAMRAHEVDPDNGVATAAVAMARTSRNRDEYKSIKQDKEKFFLTAMNQSEEEPAAGAIRSGISFETDPDRLERIRNRKSLGELHMPRKDAEERKIESKLSEPVTLSCSNQPLRQIIDDLHVMKDMNIIIDEPSLGDEGVSADRPVTIKLENVALKSALNILLRNIHLTYVIEDQVLKITTEAHARGKLKQVVYQVADLVIPVENFGSVGAPAPVNTGMQETNHPVLTAPSPVTGPYTLNTGQPVGSATGPSSGPSGFAADASGGGQVTVTKQRPNSTNEDMLIKLIMSTVQPKSWSEMGGPGTIDYFPLTMSLVINQTPDIQDQVADLLAALRRLQDQEVAVEVRFITVAEDFFERIGVNFNLNIINRDSTRFQPELTSGNFAGPGFINQFVPGRFLSGLTPANTLTSDLNIPILQQTFNQAIPAFGGYPGTPGFGGLTMGLAFLSDIQVFLFMEAVQGDIRTNVMQAPKLSLFNGQTSNLAISDVQFFVTGVNVIPQLGQFTYFPTTTLFPFGTSVTIQAVITADRRFVRLSLTPVLRNLSVADVQLFPVVTPIFPLFDGTATGQPVVFTQFVQQPRISVVSVNTTVAVPDGGTVLMGGLKKLSEDRKEYGPPVLSKIPYLNRLFKNTAYGRTAESLLIMVTPRIIIQEEEEEKQTGYIRPAAVVP